MAALEAFCRTGSLRKAAALLHLHHSSVADRLARVEDELGWRLDEPGDRFRARFALLARRLASAVTTNADRVGNPPGSVPRTESC